MFKFFKRRAFRRDYERAAADGVLTADEHRRLGEHDVDNEFAVQVRKDHFMKATEELRNRVLASHRMSPDDEAELERLANGLNIDPRLGAHFRMARELWARDNGEDVHFAPVDASSILLKADEEAYFYMDAGWSQLKTVRKRQGYSGFSTSIRIVKGLSYRVGNVTPMFSEQHRLVAISDGHLAITNKRLCFDGTRKSVSITLGRVLAVEPYKNGLEISKTSGPHDFFHMDGPISEYAAMLI